MKNVRSLFVIFTILFSSKEILAQKDSIALQRKARKLLRQGNELYQKKQYTDASVAYQKALGNNTKYEKASYNLGNALYQNKNFKEAIPQYELTAETAKDKFTKAEAYHNIGNALMESKNYQGAVDAFKNSLRNNPNDDETRYNLAVAQKLLEKDENKDKDKDKDKNENENKDKNKDKRKPQQGKMTPQQIKQLLESLNNEEKKTQKKMNAKKSKGQKVKQEKDW